MRLSAEEWERGVRLRNWLVNASTANECLGDNGWLDGQMVGWVNRWMDGRRSGEVERMIHVLWVDGCVR